MFSFFGFTVRIIHRIGWNLFSCLSHVAYSHIVTQTPRTVEPHLSGSHTCQPSALLWGGDDPPAKLYNFLRHKNRVVKARNGIFDITTREILFKKISLIYINSFETIIVWGVNQWGCVGRYAKHVWKPIHISKHGMIY